MRRSENEIQFGNLPKMHAWQRDRNVPEMALQDSVYVYCFWVYAPLHHVASVPYDDTAFGCRPDSRVMVFQYFSVSSTVPARRFH